MKKFVTNLSLPIVCLSVISCSSSSKKSAAEKAVPAGQVMSEKYVTHNTGNFQLQPFREVTLENGLKIIFVRDNTLPRVSMTLLLRTGAMQESTEQQGLNAFTAYLLEQGTQTRDATKIADDFGQLGSSLEITPGSDVTTMYSDALSISKETLLELFSDIALNPSFKEGEINRLRSQILAALRKKIDNPSAYTDDQLDEFLFGAHPYSRDVGGTPEGVKSVRKQDIIRHYLTYYRPNNATLAVVGQFGDDYEKLVQDTFGKWTKRTIPTVNVQAAPPIEKLQVRLILKKGLQQTQIRMGQIGIERVNPDFLNLRLGNEILGGGFASRLNQRVRDDLGLTYSISSFYDARKDKGSFEISTFSKNESAGKALDESLAVVADYVAKGPSEQEIEAGKSQLIGQFPRAIETADRLAYNLLVLDFYGIPVDYLTNYNKNVGALTVKSTNEALRRHLDPTKFKVIVFGPDSIKGQFEKYNPEIIRVK